MTPAQAQALKIKLAMFSEATAMLEYAKRRGNDALEMALEERDRARTDVYNLIDEMTEE